MRRAVDFLLGSRQNSLMLQFFGGEPLMLPRDLFIRCVDYAIHGAQKAGKSIKVIITTNGVRLDQFVDYLKSRRQYIRVELSLDGDKKAHNTNRPQAGGNLDSYSLLIRNIPSLLRADIDVLLSMVISPLTVSSLEHNFKHLYRLGLRQMFLMISCGIDWPAKKREALRKGLSALEESIFKLVVSRKLIFVNLKDWLPPVRMNTELIIDTDGSIYPACISYLLPRKSDRLKYRLGHLNRLKGDIDYYETRRMTNEKALYVAYKANRILHRFKNNMAAGMVMYEFVTRLNNRLALHRVDSPDARGIL